MRITTFGDLILDVIVHLDGPLVVDDDRPAETLVGAGGQAANTAAWAAAVGGHARFVGKRGADPAGELAAGELRRHGVDVCGPIAGRNGVVVSIAATGERSMASDRGSAPDLAPGELEAAWFDCDVLHISGYALAREPIASAARRAAGLARELDARVTIDLSAWTLIDDDFRDRVRALAPDLVFANKAEYETFGDLSTEWIVKRGPGGVVVAGHAYPAMPTDVVDTTGAGDAFAAGYLVGGVTTGLQTAARCCAKLGAMP
ncbi:MAG: carbohydrate kinase family protein [Actinomycetes bacterium]